MTSLINYFRNMFDERMLWADVNTDQVLPLPLYWECTVSWGFSLSVECWGKGVAGSSSCVNFLEFALHYFTRGLNRDIQQGELEGRGGRGERERERERERGGVF